jgi:hypothetical protein
MYAEAVLKVRGKFASAQGEDVLTLGEESRSSSIRLSYRASATKSNLTSKFPTATRASKPTLKNSASDKSRCLTKVYLMD